MSFRRRLLATGACADWSRRLSQQTAGEFDAMNGWKVSALVAEADRVRVVTAGVTQVE